MSRYVNPVPDSDRNETGERERETEESGTRLEEKKAFLLSLLLLLLLSPHFFVPSPPSGGGKSRIKQEVKKNREITCTPQSAATVTMEPCSTEKKNKKDIMYGRRRSPFLWEIAGSFLWPFLLSRCHLSSSLFPLRRRRLYRNWPIKT